MNEQTEATLEKKPRVALWIATGFGLGYLPVAPGTWGSLAGVALYMAVLFLSSPIFALLLPNPSAVSDADDPNRYVFSLVAVLAYQRSLLITGILLIVLVSAVGVWAARHAARYLGKSDPGQVVIDEISGQLISFVPLFAMGLTGGWWKYVLLGFILFRIFDIVKPWPANAAEKWPGGWGIMADDWVAGLYAACLLWFVQRMNWLG